MPSMLENTERVTSLKSMPNKLEVSNVREIRAKYFAGVATQEELGREFSVHQTNISQIVTYKTYRYV